jgi:predicted peptidase
MYKLLFALIIAGVLAVIVYFTYNAYLNSKVPENLLGATFKSDQVRNKSLLYRYFIPDIKNEKLPLVVYFHGASERGNDNRSQLNAASLKWIDTFVQKNFPSYVIIPQCKKDCFWVNIKFVSFPFRHYGQDSIPESDELKLFMLMLNEFVAKNNVDTQRIYLVGFSMGSTAVWDLITRYPNKFAASINMAGTSDTTKAKLITHIPVKAFNGELDNIMPINLNSEMCNSIKLNGGICDFKIFKGVGHDCVDSTYNTPGLFEWLFAQRLQ